MPWQRVQIEILPCGHPALLPKRWRDHTCARCGKTYENLPMPKPKAKRP